MSDCYCVCYFSFGDGDVDDVYSSEVVGSAQVGVSDDAGTSGAATTMEQENEPTDIFNSDLPRDTYITVKHKEHDLQLPCDHEVVDSTVVKREPADVDDVYSSEVVGSAGLAEDAGMSGAATTMKQENEPTDIFISDLPRDTNITVKHEEHYLQLPCNHEVVDSTVVKREPTDVDDVYSSEVVGSAGLAYDAGMWGAATTMKQENEPTDIFNSDLPRDKYITVKHEEHDLQLVEVEVHIVDSTVVKREPADVDDVYSSKVVGSAGPADDAGKSGAATTMKQEMGIGPTVYQPPDSQYKLRPCQPEYILGSCYETEAQLSSDKQQLHADTNQDSTCNPHVNGCTGTVLHNVWECSHDGSHKCNLCFKSLKTNVRLKCHRELRSYKCDVCWKSFQKKSYIKAHMLTHTSDRPHNIQAKKSLKTKMLTLLGERPYKCDICFKCFQSMSSLKRHMISHTGDRSQKCDVCFKSFKFKTNLKRHILKHTGVRPHNCDVCCKSFLEKETLKTHMLTHTSERPHKCDVCFKCFKTKGNLNKHMLTHTGERPHKCDVCFKCFQTKSNLVTHMLTHTGGRPHKCDVCFKCFLTKSNLNAHIILHTADRTHKCEVCFKSFQAKRNLKTHMLTHTGERPHKCDVCFKCFLTKSRLNSHIILHTADRPHKCEVCFKSFKAKKNLKTHMLTHR